jgi:copper chaperone CopZ
VRDALATLPWVKNVQVSFDKKQATFAAESARYDEAAIIRVLQDEGFGAKIAKLAFIRKRGNHAGKYIAAHGARAG